jgi:hypothetical protein
LFLNVYIPLHSGIGPEDLDEFKESLRSLRDSYPGDVICMGGILILTHGDTQNGNWQVNPNRL